MTILVTGATGRVGSELVAALVADGEPVRAMTRRPDDATVPPGTVAVYGDAAEPDSLSEAFHGVQRAFLMSAQAVGSAEGPTHDLALVTAARRAGVRTIVKLSVYDGGTVDDPIGRWHAEAEQAVFDSGIGYTLLRPGRFMSNVLGWAPMIRRGDTVHVPFAHRPAASIDPADIAAVAAVALTTEDHHGRVYQLSGPRALTPTEEVAILGARLGRSLRAVEPDAEQFRAGMLAHGMTPDVVDAVIARSHGDDGTEVLPTVRQVLGRPATDFTTWIDRHLTHFTAGR